MNSGKSQMKKISIKRKETANKQISTHEINQEIDKKEEIEEPIKKLTKYEKLKNKTEEYNNALSNVDTQLENEKKNTLIELNEINEKIKIKNNTIKKLKNQNKKLINELRNIQDEINNRLKLINIDRIDENQFENKEEKINREIKIKEKEITISIRDIDIFKKEKENLEKMINENHGEKKLNLFEEFNNLSLSIEKIEKNIKEEKEKLQLHNLCLNKKKN